MARPLLWGIGMQEIPLDSVFGGGPRFPKVTAAMLKRMFPEHVPAPGAPGWFTEVKKGPGLDGLERMYKKDGTHTKWKPFGWSEAT